jgi:hypothetical protein
MTWYSKKVNARRLVIRIENFGSQHNVQRSTSLLILPTKGCWVAIFHTFFINKIWNNNMDEQYDHALPTSIFFYNYNNNNNNNNNDIHHHSQL